MFNGNYRHSFIAHAHDAITVIQVTDGTVEIAIDSHKHEVHPGQLVIIGAQQVHSARPLDANGWSMRSLHLPSTFFQNVAGCTTAGPVAFSCPVYPGHSRDHKAFADWHSACEADEKGRAEDSYGRFANWLQHSVETFSPYHDAHVLSDERIVRARHILDQSIFDNESLDSVACQVGISTFALIRGFTKAFGLPPHTWRMQARARAAANLIRRHDALAQVAGLCGFVDQSHLARVFKRVFGVTPGQYRSMH